MLAILGVLAGFSVLTENHVDDRAAQVKTASQLSQLYGDARFWVGQEQSLARKYRVEPRNAVLRLHAQAEQNLSKDLRAILGTDHSTATQRAMAQLQLEQTAYVRASGTVFRAVEVHDASEVVAHDRAIVRRIFAPIETTVDAGSRSSAQNIGATTDLLRRDTSSATRATGIAFALALVLLSALGLVVRRLRGRVLAAHRAEVERLSRAALRDSLTGLGNHRAFHEDLARFLARAERTGRALALSMLDLNGLKTVNDSNGHQAGDERLRAVAQTLITTFGGSARTYRVGGDEFAVILADARSWDALEAVQRVQTALARRKIGVTVGIAEGLHPDQIDSVIRTADLALTVGKHRRQEVTVYSPELEAGTVVSDAGRDADHVDSLSRALALAVDAKDSYTRSHCQTVSQLCALVATELGFGPLRVDQMRLAGLLHDVGKIGIPDAILHKPRALTKTEYEEMKRHSVLGEQIVAAGDLCEEAHWVSHHHERYDGRGYPDGLAGEEIPLESRIILGADAFEAMTSDRPYRRAPGREFAIGELRRHAGTQFDPNVVEALCRVLDASPADTDLAGPTRVDQPPAVAPLRLLTASPT